MSWKSADDDRRSLINYILNATTADMELNNSATIEHPATKVNLHGLPQYSAGTVSVWAQNPGALSKPVTSAFKMVNIVTNGRHIDALGVFTLLKQRCPIRSSIIFYICIT